MAVNWFTKRPLWQRFGLLFLLGALAALAHAPLFIFPMILPFLAAAYMIADCRRPMKHRFWSAYFLFWGYYVAGLYWLANAIATDLARFWWLMPFAVLGVPAFLAMLNAPAIWLIARLRLSGWSLIFSLSASWLIFDVIRATAFTGFPWNMVGQIWAGYLWPLQAASLVGVWGLTAATLLVSFALTHFLGSRYRVAQRSQSSWGALGFAVALTLVIPSYGAWRLADEGAQAETALPNVRLRLIQPDIQQGLKWDPDFMAANVQRQVDMSNEQSTRFSLPPTHVIWPESAVPYALGGAGDFPRQLAQAALNSPDAVLITGANRLVREDDTSFNIWNSLFALNFNGETVATYDKSHLVPFGEYIPLRKVLAFLPALNAAAPSSTDFTAGLGPATIDIPGLPPTSPNICYESIFPSRVTDGTGRANLLLTITNDGWFGRSTGPHQHLAQARLRSVEEGLPQIRVSNPGVSVVMDYLGRDRVRLGLGLDDFLDSDLTIHREVPTLFARIRDFILIFLIALLAVSGIGVRLFGNKNHDPGN